MKYTFFHRFNCLRGGKTPPRNNVFRVDTIEAFDGFQQAGYITLTHIPDKPWLEEPYWWLGLNNTVSGPTSHVITCADDIFKMPRSFLNSNAWKMLVDIFNYREANENYERFKILQSDQDAAKVLIQKIIPLYMGIRKNRLDFMWTKRYHNECGMYTDFIRVHERYRGTGLAEQLYYRAALMARNMGKRYRFSNCQQIPAKKVMQRFIDRGMVIKERRRMFYKIHTFNYLDTSKPLWFEV